MEAASLPGDPSADTVVLLCSDVSELGPSPTPAGRLATELHRLAPQCRVFVVEHLCSDLPALAHSVRALGCRSVAIGCRQATERRPEITAQLRRAGIHPAAIQLVDLMPPGTTERASSERSVAMMRAALGRLSCVAVGSPVHERSAAAAVLVSRRNLLHAGELSRRPVAFVVPARCNPEGGCRACVLSCPYGALRLAGGSVAVDAALCTGCGACLSACRSGAISLNGTSIEELEAATEVLVAEVRRLRPVIDAGIAIVCRPALPMVDAPAGGTWLPLEVPSLEMVTAGWLLQLVAAGISVRLVGCKEPECSGRQRRLTRHFEELVEAMAPSARPRRSLGGPIELREPEATAGALTALAAGPPRPAHCRWRLESSEASLGEVTLRSGCSACGCCTKACPTAALAAEPQEVGAFELTFDSAMCTACGACVAACPEGTLSLRRVIDPVRLFAGRRLLGTIPVGGRCTSCGGPLVEGLDADIVARRLSASHPEIATRLQRERRCADCLLMARV